MEAQSGDSFPIEAGREFLRLIERYDRFVNEVKYAEQEAYAKACDPITGEFDEEKYQDPEDDEELVRDDELDALVELANSTERGEEERAQATNAISALFKRRDAEYNERKDAEHDEIWGAIAASRFWTWLWQHDEFQQAVSRFMAKRKFPNLKYVSFFDEHGQEVEPSSPEFDRPGAMERLRRETYRRGLKMDEDDMYVFALLAAKSLIEYHEISDEDIRQYCELRTLVRRELDKLRAGVLARASSRPWVAHRLEKMLPQVHAARIDVRFAHRHARREWFIKDLADKYHYNFLCVHADVIARVACIIDPNIGERAVYRILERVRPHLHDRRMDPSRPERYDPRF